MTKRVNYNKKTGRDPQRAGAKTNRNSDSDNIQSPSERKEDVQYFAQ
jgi:hypothetical protein